MLYQEILNRETASLPDYLKRELLDFLYFLKKKGKNPRSVSEPFEEGGSKPAFGCGSVKVKIAPDFDAPIDDFKEYMS